MKSFLRASLVAPESTANARRKNLMTMMMMMTMISMTM